MTELGSVTVTLCALVHNIGSWDREVSFTLVNPQPTINVV